MKKLIIGVTVLLVGLQVEARGKIEVAQNRALNKPVISLINTNNQYDQLNVTDSNTGKVVFTKSISKKSNHQEVIDFSKSGSNNYTVELKKDANVLTKEVTIVNDKVIHNEFDANEYDTDKIRFFITNNNSKMVVSCINAASESLNLEIVDMDTNKKVKNKYIGEVKQFTGKYDVSKLKSGVNYKATLYAGHTAYYYNFTL